MVVIVCFCVVVDVPSACANTWSEESRLRMTSERILLELVIELCALVVTGEIVCSVFLFQKIRI